MNNVTGAKTRKLLGALLFMILVVFMGCYFWTSLSHRKDGPISVVEKKLTPHDAFLAIHVDNDCQCWVVGKYGLILHSEDHGKSWVEQASGTNETLTALSFVDNKCGFVVGSNGTVLATSDGGLSWEAQSSGTREQLLGVKALTSTDAIAVGGFGTIIATSNGGKTWKQQKLLWKELFPVFFAEGITEINLNALHFVSQNVGWVVGEFGLILHTNDGGQSWIPQRSGHDFPELFELVFRDQHTGWAVGQRGCFIRTSDGGQHWTPLELGTDRDLYAISISGKHGVIVGDGVGFKTNDGCSTWRRIESIQDNIWFNGVSVASISAIAVGEHGKIDLINLEDPDGDPAVGEK